MSGNDDKGDEWIEKGDNRVKKFSLFGGGSKYEEAAEMYIKGANLYKISKKWEQAGAAFIKAAESQLKLQSKHEAATNYINAGNCLKKSNVNDAGNCLRIAIELFTDEGRFSIAAKHQKELAEMFEAEEDYQQAIDNYQTASDYYEGEGQTSSSNACLLKVAQFSAQLEKYDKAIEIYERVAKASLDNNLLKWSVKEYFLKAGLCHLASGDIVSAKRAVERYQEMDYTFSSQRECKLLQDLITACENYDVEAFTQSVADYDSISKLDQWKTHILLKVKNSIKNEDGGLA